MKPFGKTFWLIGALAVGALGYPWLHGGADLVKYLLMGMLFLTFLPLEAHPRMLDWPHGRLLLAQVALALLVYPLLHPVDPLLAAAGVMIALTPTATAAPVVTRLLGGDIGFVTVAMFLSNLAAALLLPLALSWLAPGTGGGAAIAARVMANLGLVVVAPLSAALLLRRGWPAAARTVARGQPFSLYLWCAALVLISARATHTLATAPSPRIVASALLALLLCIVNFTVGHALGGRHRRLECGQALGQKNTVLIIWVCLTFLDPETALAPTFYVIWHNLANSWQLWRHARAAPLARG